MKKRILVLADVFLARDARILRQLEFLRNDYELSCLCWEAGPVEGVAYIELGERTRRGLPSRVAGAFRSGLGFQEAESLARPFYRAGLAPALASGHHDLVIANDVDTLPLAFMVARACGAKILLDAHEYAPGQFEDSLRWRLTSGRHVRWLCSRYIPGVDGMITVCGSIAELYAREFGKMPRVVTNAPAYEELEPSPTSAGSIRLVYHGAVNPNRRIENMLRVADALPDGYSLTMMITNQDGPYARVLRSKAGQKVLFVPPVAHTGVARAIREYDVGLYLLEPHNTNQRLALPNKLFEFVQGRLAVAVGPSEEMAAVVRRYDLGLVSPDFTPAAMARAIAALGVGDIERFKRNADAAARILNAETNRLALLETVGGIL